MVIKLNSLDRWATLAANEAIAFGGHPDMERRVRLQFNLEAVTTFFIERDAGADGFLCTLPPGVEILEFNCSGAFRIFAEEGSAAVHYQSAELEDVAVEVVDPVIFTKIAQRRSRNPELEQMMYKMQLNQERRFAAQAAEMQALLRQQQELLNARQSVAVDARAASTSGSAEVLAQGSIAPKPGEVSATVAGSKSEGSGDDSPA